MNANYTEICRVGIMEANFQQVLLVHFFLFWILLRNINNSNSAKKSKKKNIFLEEKYKKKTLYYRNCIGQAIFDCKCNFRVNIWEQNTETEKTNGFWEDTVNQNKLFSFEIKRQAKKGQ